MPEDSIARPLPRRSRPVQVADRIKDWVVERDLKTGARLPSEAEMIAQFGVSKGTVREAMRILEAQGLIITRTGPGGGSFVGEVTAERAKSLLANYFYFQQLSITDIYQMRKMLEPELAASMAGRLERWQLDELRELATRHDRPAQSPEEERDQHVTSLRFHERLAEFAGNPLLGFCVSFMARILADLTVYRRLYEPHNEELWARGRQHQIDLVAALERGDAGAARATMRSHMEGAEEMMQRQEAQVMRRFMGSP
ncbi:FCD domain-containing protein [Roseibacterium sp. SDUM158016]|jgi:GntR family transcriptional repressor for pyruvate dehydrogenase complex|uniref:FadR/GntR family transcriptional regulator n=1 Tax=Roseicyclus sediminis TaxID=2980997 RepID=UPI0021D2BC80|nr:FCD domain-containing protein [Roseibacterium sp. SDUM158016]MCU4651208.1 FCD domain-containing protein [Roseibacterium sp. SDUM158016]